MKEKLEVLICDKELRENMGLQSRRIAERDFSIENVVAKHINIYKSLID